MQNVQIQYNGVRKPFNTKVNFINCFDERVNPIKQHALPLLYKGEFNEDTTESTIGTVDKLSEDTFIINLAPIEEEVYTKVFENIDSMKLQVKPIEGGNGYLFILKDN